GRYTADAIACFAFGRDVLPVDTNVARVRERTGEAFDAGCGQALMALGATVCLARVPRCDSCPLAPSCPSRGRRYEPRRKQSRFEGSFRQRRAATLRLVTCDGRTAALRLVTAAARRVADLDPVAVAALEHDGLVSVAAGLVSLPVEGATRPE